MSVSVVLVLDEPGFADRAAAALTRLGYQAMAIANPLAALDQLEGTRPQLLVTSVEHGRGKQNGLSLVRMLRLKNPSIKVLFLGPAEFASHTQNLGHLMPSPVTVPQVVDGVIGMLESSQP